MLFNVIYNIYLYKNSCHVIVHKYITKVLNCFFFLRIILYCTQCVSLHNTWNENVFSIIIIYIIIYVHINISIYNPCLVFLRKWFRIIFSLYIYIYICESQISLVADLREGIMTQLLPPATIVSLISIFTPGYWLNVLVTFKFRTVYTTVNFSYFVGSLYIVHIYSIN